MKKALITGITGQDGSYLAELLLEKGYEVHALIRPQSISNTFRIDHVKDQIVFHFGDISNTKSVNAIVGKIQPDEIYNLAAQSHVGASFEMSEYTINVAGLGSLRLLDAVRLCSPNSKFYQASTSEMFGKISKSPQNEQTPFYPRSPYGCAKVLAHNLTVNYRETYDIFACSGILFNHESPRRSEEFVTRKITKKFAEMKIAIEKKKNFHALELGNLEAKRDWGDARDYVLAMWKMLQKKTANDYVVATGETRTVREFVEVVAGYFEFDLEWSGEELNEIGRDRTIGKTLVKINKEYYRPEEKNLLVGDNSKAVKELGWNRKFSFDDMVKDMCENDISMTKDKK